MSLLDRYKKPGGFVQLLALLETCAPQKKDKFLSMIKEESTDWELALRPRILTVDRVFTWSPVVLTEILSRLQTLSIAVLYSSFDENRRNLMNGVLNFSQHKQVKEIIDGKVFTLSEINISMEKFLSEARSLITQGVIKLDKIDPELEIPLDIEEKLNSKVWQKSPEASKKPQFGSFGKIVVIENNENQRESGSTNSQSITDDDYNDPYNDELEIKTKKPNLDNLLNKQAAVTSVELQSELHKLRDKVQVLLQENLMLKHEVEFLNNKLEKIRKIA